MTRYRRRPPIVEAVQWDGSSHTANAFIGEDYGVDWEYQSTEAQDIVVHPRQWLKAWVKVGDWLVKNRGGSFHSYTPEEFTERFEEIDASEVHV